MILRGDARHLSIGTDSVDCVVTSPPYWQQRCYGVAGQIGRESTIAAYLREMVAVFREVRRVLKPWGSVWINLGDKRISDGGASVQGITGQCSNRHRRQPAAVSVRAAAGLRPGELAAMPARLVEALREDGWWIRAQVVWDKPCPQPETLYGWSWERCPAGQESCSGCDRCQDGWILRRGSWRPTTAHELVYLLTPGPEHYIDQVAALEPVTGRARPRGAGVNPKAARAPAGGRQNSSWSAAVRGLVGRRNPRSVWRILPQPYRPELFGGEVLTWRREPDPACPVHVFAAEGPCTCQLEASSATHHASFPEELAARCIRPSTSLVGNCPRCGMPWVRKLERRRTVDGEHLLDGTTWHQDAGGHSHGPQGFGKGHISTQMISHGWRPSCRCELAKPVRAVVLDPFAGTGATCAAAKGLCRRFIGVELSMPSCRLAKQRANRPLQLSLEVV